MLIGITGDLGAGKTLSGVILSNFIARTIGVELKSNMERMIGSDVVRSMKEVWQLNNCVFLWDEMWLTADSRLWKNNVAMSQFIMLTRKKGLIIIYTAQMFGQVDKRIRGVTDYVITCEKREEGIWLSFLHMYSGTIGRRYLIPEPSQFYSLYNTLEIPLLLK